MSFEGYHVIENNGSPAKERFTDANAVRAVYQHFRDDDMEEARRRTKIKKMFDGFLPYDPAQLRNSGLRNITNVNWLGLKSVIKSRAGVILRLSSDTANLIELRPMARELAGPDAERIARVVSEEFSTTLREVGKFIPMLAAMNQESDLYGLGPVTWQSSIDYNPVALERSQVQFRGDGPVLSSEHDIIMFESVLPAAYVFQLLDNEPVAAAEGWDLKEVKKWAIQVFRDGYETASQPGAEPGSTVMETQLSLIRRNMYSEEHQFDDLKVIHVFVREYQFPRGVTHYILPASADDAGFLFKKPNAYQRMDDCFIWFPYDISEKYAKSVRGLASDLYAPERAANRMKCAFVDSAARSLSMFFSQQSLGGQTQLTLNEQGPYTFIPKEFVPVQNNVRPDLQSGIMALQYMDNLGVNAVAGTDKQPLSTTSPKLFQNDKPTKAEAEIAERRRVQKDEALFVQRVAVIDKIARQTFQRFVRLVALVANPEVPNPVIMADYPEVMEFLRRCQLRQVTPDQIMAIPQMFMVTACRDLVLGSEGKVGVLNDILSAYGGTLDEPGRKNAVRDVVQLRLGSVSADRYAPEVTRDNAPNDQSSFATMENNQIKMGFEVMVGQDQLHWSHIPVHAQLLQEIVDMVKAPADNAPELNDWNGSPEESMQVAQQTLQNLQEDPRKILGIFVQCSQHVQQHLAIGGMQIGMQDQTKQVQKMLRDLRPTVKALNLAVATQERIEQAEREKQEREMAELRAQAEQNELAKAQYEVDKKAEVDRYRVDREHEVQMHKLELEGRRGQVADDMAAGRAAADEARKDAETKARIDREMRMTRSKINAANALNRFNAVNDVTGQSATTPAEIAGEQPGQEASLDYMSL